MGKTPDELTNFIRINRAIDPSLELIYVSSEMIRSDRQKIRLLVPIVTLLSQGFEMLFKTVLRVGDPSYKGGHQIKTLYTDVMSQLQATREDPQWSALMQEVQDNVVTQRLMLLLEAWANGDRFAAVDALGEDPRDGEWLDTQLDEVAFGPSEQYEDYQKAGNRITPGDRDAIIYRAVMQLWDLVVEGIRRGYCPGIPKTLAVATSADAVGDAIGKFTIEPDL